jgi:hypothetical protein
LLVLTIAILRVVNAEAHLYNMVPVAALGLFSGSVLTNKKWAYMIPLTAMFLSDVGLNLFTTTPGFYGVSQIVNYLALGLVTLLGTALVKRNTINVLGFTLGGSMIFFLVSNFGTFLQGYYGYHFEGFTACYAMALPFYKSEFSTTIFMNSFLGDIIFSAVAFGIFYLASLPKLTLKKA